MVCRACLVVCRGVVSVGLGRIYVQRCRCMLNTCMHSVGLCRGVVRDGIRGVAMRVDKVWFGYGKSVSSSVGLDLTPVHVL